MSLTHAQYQSIHDSLDAGARCIMDRVRGRFYPGTTAYREVLQVQLLREYILEHFVETLDASLIYFE